MVVGTSPSLYVGDLKEDVNEALLFERFNQVGQVANVRVCRDGVTRRSLGYAYINYVRIEDAERALDTLNFLKINGKPCRIMWSQRDPVLRKSGLGNIFVKDLAKSIDNKSLFDTFSMFGSILSCKVATDPKTGESLGYGFVHYDNEESCKDAIARVNGKMIAEKKVTVMLFKPKKNRPESELFTNLYIKNIPTTWDSETFVKYFSSYGPVTSSSLSAGENGANKGYGFINFEKPEQAKAAMESLNGADMGEKKLVICRAEKKKDREKKLAIHYRKLKQKRESTYVGVNLYIKNLSDEMNDEKLRAKYSAYGQIASAKVMLKNGKSRGFGFVAFVNRADAQKALEATNGKMENGKPLYVAMAQKKEVRRAHLEAQFASKGKMGQLRQPLYPGAQQQMFYPGVTQPMMQQMIPGMYPNAMPGAMPGAMPAGIRQGFQLMPVGNNANVNVRQRRGAGKQINQAQQRQYDNARNQAARYQQMAAMQRRMQLGAANPHQISQQHGQLPQQRPSLNQGAQNSQHVQIPQQHTQVSPTRQSSMTDNSAIKDSSAQTKQLIGERLYPRIKEQRPQLAGKITGMLLEMDNSELHNLLQSPQALDDKINEALQVLREHEQNA